MATKEQLAASTLYANIMEEIKHRIAAIDAGTGGKLPIPAPFIREFCYLQIRMICELVAFGCLVAHGDIEATKSNALRTQWSADTIIKKLDDLHPEFFPVAARQGAPSGGVKPLEAIEPPPLTKADFLKLYAECNNALHRGNLKKLMKQQMPTQFNFPEITAKAQKLVNLLGIHVVMMRGGEKMFIAILRNANDNMKVQVAIAESA